MNRGSWAARVRTKTLALTDPITYSRAVLTENYNVPDTLQITGRLNDLRPALVPGYGLVLSDDAGVQRFSGIVADIERLGSGTGMLTFLGDLIRLKHRIVWPLYTAAWTAQSAAYDVQTATAEARLLTYVNRNAGSIAYNVGGTDRRIPNLRLPTSLNRGPSAKTSARFNNLLELAALLAEQASLRLRIVQTYVGTTPYLDVTLTAVPDLSASVRFGDSAAAGTAMLGEEWRYRAVMPTGTAVLSAATGEKEARILTAGTPDAAAQTLWGVRIEHFIDQRQTSDATELNQGLIDALAENVGTVEVAVPIVDSAQLSFGSDIPLGSRVSAVLDGETITERIRQIVTTISGDSEATVAVVPTLGTPDAGLASPTQQRIAAMLKRLSLIERNQ